MKKTLIIILVFLFWISVLIYNKQAEQTSRTNKQNRYVHLSLDDVWIALNQLTINENQLDSIFEVKLFKELRKYNLKYGAKVTLYLYEKNSKADYNINDVTVKFKDEFEKNSSWLKFGFHTIEPDSEFDKIGIEEFKKSIDNVNNAIKNFASEKNISDTLRLNYFRGTQEQLNILKKAGVKNVLCADDNRLSYDLTKEETSKLYELDFIDKSGIRYYKTDLRLDNISYFKIYNSLSAKKEEEVLVVFIHEWALRRKYFKLERTIKWLEENEYKFMD